MVAQDGVGTERVRFAGCEGDEFQEGLGKVGERWEEVGMRFGTAAGMNGVVVGEGLESFCEMERGVGISIFGSSRIVFAFL